MRRRRTSDFPYFLLRNFYDLPCVYLYSRRIPEQGSRKCGNQWTREGVHSFSRASQSRWCALVCLRLSPCFHPSSQQNGEMGWQYRCEYYHARLCSLSVWPSRWMQNAHYESSHFTLRPSRHGTAHGVVSIMMLHFRSATSSCLVHTLPFRLTVWRRYLRSVRVLASRIANTRAWLVNFVRERKSSKRTTKACRIFQGGEH